MRMKTKTVRNNGGVPDTQIEYQGMGHVRIKGPFTCAAVYDLQRLAAEDEGDDILSAAVVGEISDEMECRWLDEDELDLYGFDAEDEEICFWIARSRLRDARNKLLELQAEAMEYVLAVKENG
jgi:hypothetical protein